MPGESVDKLANILCAVHNRKIQFINIGADQQQLFICSDCLKKNKQFCIENINDFVSVDEFKNEYMREVAREMDNLKAVVSNQQAHIANHMKEQTQKIEEDFEGIKDTLVQYVKSTVNGLKSQLVKRLVDLNTQNSKSLNGVSDRLSEMMETSAVIQKELNSALVTSIQDTSKLQRIIIEFLIAQKEFSANLKDMKIVGSNFASKEIVCDYTLDKHSKINVINRIKEKINSACGSIIGGEEFLSKAVQKPTKNIKDIRYKHSNIMEMPRFSTLKETPSLKYLGQFELARHASHHVLSSCLVNGVFLATGHLDSSFKLWLLNSQFFETPFSSKLKPAISCEEMMLSGTTSGTGANFKKKEVTEMKPDSSVQPLKLVFSSTPDHHKFYVTAINFLSRKSRNEMLLLTGDAGGELLVSELIYSPHGQSLEAVTPLFRKRAHKGQIVSISLFKHEDVAITAGQDGAIIFWDLTQQTKIIHMEEHDLPIASLVFADDYSSMVSSSRSELIVWKVGLQENPDFYQDKENQAPLENKEKTKSRKRKPDRFLLEAKIVKALGLEDKGQTCCPSKLFSSNLKHDYLVFLSVNSDIKLLNTLNGKYVGEIEGAHFKGPSNYALLFSPGYSSLLSDVESSLLKSPSALMDLFISQLNNALLISVSCKDRLKVWGFREGVAVPRDQAACLGGGLDQGLPLLKTRQQEAVVLSLGSGSNKLELFRV